MILNSSFDGITATNASLAALGTTACYLPNFTPVCALKTNTCSLDPIVYQCVINSFPFIFLP